MTAISQEQALRDVAEILYLEPEALDLSADLGDQGMDSVRIMDLVERWRSAGVDDVDFILLAQDQRMEAWLRELERLQAV
ncbi:MAG: phosphopantetheine-binding protein [Citricoccus sp.]